MTNFAQHKVEVIVTVAEGHRENLRQIAHDLKSCGLEITGEPLQSLGMISGITEAKNIDQLRTLNGVTTVEKAGTVQIAPPESDVQ
jgi:hypothetical protein